MPFGGASACAAAKADDCGMVPADMNPCRRTCDLCDMPAPAVSTSGGGAGAGADAGALSACDWAPVEILQSTFPQRNHCTA